MKKISIVIILCSTISCSFFNEDSKAQNNMNTEASNPAVQENQEGYIVKPKYDHPKFKELDAAFAKQEHRFEIDRCVFKYNGKSFFIGDSEEKIISILGEPEDKFISPNKDDYNFKYKKLKFIVWFSKKEMKVKSVSWMLKDYPGYEEFKYKIIKFRKVPYHLDMTLNDFMELSDLSHDENLDHDTSAFYIHNERKCYILIETSIGSTPNFYSTGGGHMTMRGAFNPESTGAIDILGVGLKENK